jgi:hypothetical protein
MIVLLLTFVTSSVGARSPMALGTTVNPTDARDMGVVDDVVRTTGAKPALWSLWSVWGSRGGQQACTPAKGTCAFPAVAASGLKARGITPMIWWLPTGPDDAFVGTYSRYIRIIKGRHDAYIRRWALDARAHGGPIVLRFAHEPNGHWYPWGLARLDNSPKRFKRAWRHIWGIFRSVGATNVKFLWNPIEEGCAGCQPNIRFDRFYPGNKYVDYVGINVFNWSWGRRWQSLPRLLERPVRRLRQVTSKPWLPRGKPVIVGEVASSHIGGNKAKWIRNGYARTYKRLAMVKAIVYLDVDMRRSGHPDWRLLKPTDGSALRAYSSVAAMSRFKGVIP